jgi:hypothetical protein
MMANTTLTDVRDSVLLSPALSVGSAIEQLSNSTFVNEQIAIPVGTTGPLRRATPLTNESFYGTGADPSRRAQTGGLVSDMR